MILLSLEAEMGSEAAVAVLLGACVDVVITDVSPVS